MNKVDFYTVQRVTKSNNGVVAISVREHINTDDETATSIGVVEYAKGSDYDAITLRGDVLGSYTTRSGAGHALYRLFKGTAVERAVVVPQIVYVTVVEAAAKLGKSVSTVRRMVAADKLETRFNDANVLVVAVAELELHV